MPWSLTIKNMKNMFYNTDIPGVNSFYKAESFNYILCMVLIVK